METIARCQVNELKIAAQEMGKRAESTPRLATAYYGGQWAVRRQLYRHQQNCPACKNEGEQHPFPPPPVGGLSVVASARTTNHRLQTPKAINTGRMPRGFRLLSDQPKQVVAQDSLLMRAVLLGCDAIDPLSEKTGSCVFSARFEPHIEDAIQLRWGIADFRNALQEAGLEVYIPPARRRRAALVERSFRVARMLRRAA